MTGWLQVLGSRPLEPQVFLWPLLFGLAAVFILAAQPIGRPKPDLAQRLRRLDVDERIRTQLAGTTRSSFFLSGTLERILRPVLDDLGRLVQMLLGRLGVRAGSDLQRKLGITRPGVESAQFFGEKVGCALIGGSVLPLMNLAGIHPFGPWPVWGAAGGLLAGYRDHLEEYESDQQNCEFRCHLLRPLYASPAS